LTPQIISNTALWVHPCEFVPIITSLAYRDWVSLQFHK
jgi:hypothetical protein